MIGKLNELQRPLRPYAQYLVGAASRHYSGVRVTSVRRTWGEQARLFERFVRGESRLPAAPPGRSKHQLGIAFDVARIGHDPLTDPALRDMGRVWRWMGGRWSESDPVHFEV